MVEATNPKEVRFLHFIPSAQCRDRKAQGRLGFELDGGNNVVAIRSATYVLANGAETIYFE